jgi:N utilization substance protein B
MASRHLARSIVLQSLYEWDFYNGEKEDLDKILERNIGNFGSDIEDLDFVEKLAKGILRNFSKIDKIILISAPERPIEQISIIDRNVLRIGLFELLYAEKKEVPPKVAINEAIELAKSFGGENSGKFVNGVLGTIYKEMPESREEKEIGGQGMELPEETLAGGIVYRKTNGNYQIALIKDIFNYWTFPKGHVEKGENLEQTVLREIKEEIGLENLTIEKNLGERIYKAKNREKGGYIKRKVADFLLEAAGSETELKIENSTGIKEGQWFNLDDIASLRQYKEPGKTLQKVVDSLKQK